MIRRLAIAALALFVGLAAIAQDSERGRLQALLEDSLSGAGREVRIEGFQGALTGRATFDLLTVADADGIWITIHDGVFDWNRAQLLRGSLSIAEMSATAVDLARWPRTDPSLPSPEATPVVLPDLPISVDIDLVSVARLSLGAPILGTAAAFSLSGSASLAEGSGAAKITADRTDGTQGRLALAAAYQRDTNELSVDLELDEPTGGLAAELLGIPQAPDIRFVVSGAGPLSGFAADLTLDSGGVRRVTGRLGLQDIGQTASNLESGRRFDLDLNGDIRTLVERRFHPFLGDDVTVSAAGRRLAEGALRLDALEITAGALRLSGTYTGSDQGWPESFSLKGRVSPPDGQSVIVPIPGRDVSIGPSDVEIGYDRSAGNAWSAKGVLSGLITSEIAVERVVLDGSGSIESTTQSVDGSLEISATGLVQTDTALNRAVGPGVAVAGGFAWSPGRPLSLSELSVDGSDYRLSGAANVTRAQGSVDLEVDGDVQLSAADLSRFSGVAGMDLGGAADLRLSGRVAPVSAGFDLRADGRTNGLRIGVPQLDAIFAQAATLSVEASRGADGIRLPRLAISATGADLAASGSLRTGKGNIDAILTLADLSPVVAEAPGPARLSLSVRQDGEVWTGRMAGSAPGGTEVSAEGSAKVSDEWLVQSVEGTAEFSSADLAVWRGIARRPISGSTTLTLTGGGDPVALTGRAALDGTVSDITTGLAELDILLRGDGAVASVLERDDQGTIGIEKLDARTAHGSATVSGTYGPGASDLSFELSLADLGNYVDGLSGPAAADGRVTSDGGPWQVATNVRAPGGTAVTASGGISRDLSTVNLSLAGDTSLVLLNRSIAPNLADGAVRFDLRVDGPPKLDALSGTARIVGGGLTITDAALALADVGGDIRFGGGKADVDLNGSVTSGGRVAVTGSAGLAAPYDSALTIRLDGLERREQGLYDTSVDGSITLTGPVTGGARIDGDLSLGPTELRLSDIPQGEAGGIAGLSHVNEGAAGRLTRSRAGMVQTSGGGNKATNPVDIIIRAPNRVFIRGRGLDAELGGSLRLTGRTSAIDTVGRFDLIRGRLDILGRRLTLSEASIEVQGDFDPYVRAVAETQVEDVLIQVIVEGLASEPTITFTSAPELPQDEILARMLFGRSVAEISPLQALRIAAAIRTLSGKGGPGLTDRVRNEVGLDDLDVTTGADGQAEVTAGKYLSDNIYSDVTVDAQGRSEINLNLSISPSVTGRGAVATDGTSSVGIFFERDY